MKLKMRGKNGEGWSGHGEYEPGIDPSLMSCPFCGSEDIEVSNTHTPYYTADCQGCDAAGPRSTYQIGDTLTRSTPKMTAIRIHQEAFKAAIAVWNRRAA